MSQEPSEHRVYASALDAIRVALSEQGSFDSACDAVRYARFSCQGSLPSFSRMSSSEDTTPFVRTVSMELAAKAAAEEAAAAAAAEAAFVESVRKEAARVKTAEVPTSWLQVIIRTALIIVTFLMLALLVFPPLSSRSPGPRFTQDIPIEFGHNGGGGHAPENTLAAIEFAAARKARGVELDVLLTQDNVLVAFHDTDVSLKTDGSGSVAATTYPDLEKLNAAHSFCHGPIDAGAPPPPSNGGRKAFCAQPHRIPTLLEAVDLALKLKLLVILEAKPGIDVGASVPLLSDLFESRPALYEQALVISFLPHFLYQIKHANPKVATVLLFGRQSVSHLCRSNRTAGGPLCYAPSVIDAFLYHTSVSSWWARFLGLSGLAPHISVATPALLSSLSGHCHYTEDGHAPPCFLYVWGGRRVVDAEVPPATTAFTMDYLS